MHKPQFSAAGLTENKCNVFFRKLSSMLLFKKKQKNTWFHFRREDALSAVVHGSVKRENSFPLWVESDRDCPIVC